MKEHNPSCLSDDVWIALYLLLRNAEASGIERGVALDEITPTRIETTKQGVEIGGSCSFLPMASGKKNEFKMNYKLMKPKFTSIQSITASKVRDAKLEKFDIIEDWVEVEIS